MDKYRRVEKPKSDISDIRENEVRITTQGKMRNYISYATNLLSEQVPPLHHYLFIMYYVLFIIKPLLPSALRS
jgi:hypothetical protein